MKNTRSLSPKDVAKEVEISVRTLYRWSDCSRVSYLEQAFHLLGVRLEVLDQPSLQEPAEERKRDLMTIVAVWAARFSGEQARGCAQAGRSSAQAHTSGKKDSEDIDGTGQTNDKVAPRPLQARQRGSQYQQTCVA